MLRAGRIDASAIRVLVFPVISISFFHVHPPIYTHPVNELFPPTPRKHAALTIFPRGAYLTSQMNLGPKFFVHLSRYICAPSIREGLSSRVLALLLTDFDSGAHCADENVAARTSRKTMDRKLNVGARGS